MTNKENKEKLYDQASLHFMSGNFPDTLPIDQAYVHIGMYLGWIVDNNLYSDFFEKECDTQIFRFKQRQITPAILSEIWNGKLCSHFFTEEGNMFTFYYYGGGLYHKDYVQTLCNNFPSMYHINDSWDNFTKISAKITDRYIQWKKEIYQ